MMIKIATTIFFLVFSANVLADQNMCEPTGDSYVKFIAWDDADYDAHYSDWLGNEAMGKIMSIHDEKNKKRINMTLKYINGRLKNKEVKVIAYINEKSPRMVVTGTMDPVIMQSSSISLTSPMESECRGI